MMHKMIGYLRNNYQISRDAAQNKGNIVEEGAVVENIEQSGNTKRYTMGSTMGNCIALHLLAQMVEDFEVYTRHQRCEGLCIIKHRLKVPTTKLGKLSFLGCAPFFVNMRICTCIVIANIFLKQNN